MKVWITRDENGSVCIWNGNKDLSKSRGEWLSDEDIALELDSMSGQLIKQFKKFFGFTPRKGSCKKYELTLTEVK